MIIPDGLLRVDKDEYFTISVNSFYCYNDFYQCNINCNSFNIYGKSTSGVISAQQLFYLPVGNPNINDIISSINSVLQLEMFYHVHMITLKIKLHIQDSYHKQQTMIHFILTLLKLAIF